MSVTQKQVKDQVIVITGASSGIGLATAKEAASRGARVVLNSRDPVDLAKAVQEIREDGDQIEEDNDAKPRDEAFSAAHIVKRAPQAGGIPPPLFRHIFG